MCTKSHIVKCQYPSKVQSLETPYKFNYNTKSDTTWWEIWDPKIKSYIETMVIITTWPHNVVLNKTSKDNVLTSFQCITNQNKYKKGSLLDRLTSGKQNKMIIV